MNTSPYCSHNKRKYVVIQYRSRWLLKNYLPKLLACVKEPAYQLSFLNLISTTHRYVYWDIKITYCCSTSKAFLSFQFFHVTLSHLGQSFWRLLFRKSSTMDSLRWFDRSIHRNGTHTFNSTIKHPVF